MKKASPPRVALLLLLSVVGLTMAPSVAMAQAASSQSSSSDNKATSEEEGEAQKKEEEKPKQSIGVSGALNLVMGQGLFTVQRDLNEGDSGRQTSKDQIRKPPIWSRFSSSQEMTLGISIGADYTYGDHNVSVGISGKQFLVGGENRFADFLFNDLQAEYSWAGYKIEAINSRISASADITLPTSVRSREAGMIADIGGGVSFGTSIIDAFRVSAGLSVDKIFNKYNGGVAPVRYDEYGRRTVYARAGELIGGNQAFVGGIPTEWFVSFTAGIGWSLWVLDFGLRYTFRNAWTHNVTLDPSHVSGAQNADGDRIAKSSGRRHSQAGYGVIFVSYAPSWLEGLRFSLSFNNSQAPKTGDQFSYRFPFWNFEGANEGSSWVSFRVGYGYDFDL